MIMLHFIHDWVERNEVYCKIDEHLGKLKVGFGTQEHFGPELGFGWELGDAYNSPCGGPLIFLAWAGRDLAIDFPPPSTGKGQVALAGVNRKGITFGLGPNLMRSQTLLDRKYRPMLSDTLAALGN